MSVCEKISPVANVAEPTAGWTAAYSLNPPLAEQTADFLVFSALTTVARRPGLTCHGRRTGRSSQWSATRRPPTVSWTWTSFCFTFSAFGLVLFVYEIFLNNPDDAPMDPALAISCR